MEELYYFPVMSLMVKVVYAKEANSLRFATHRAIKPNERRMVEKYILSEFAPQTEYYQRSPSLLLYMGVDRTLRKKLGVNQVRETIKHVLSQKSQVEASVKKCISEALSAYYFERIGDELINLKKSIQKQPDHVDFAGIVSRIAILLEAYNENSGQNIRVETILPKEALLRYEQHQPQEV